MYDFISKQFEASRTSDMTDNAAKMDAPTIQPKFLSRGNELGLVAVGFSGGQVSPLYTARHKGDQ